MAPGTVVWWKHLAVMVVVALANRADKAINMPDLGRRFQLGELYDATTDELVGGGLWPLSIYQNKDYVVEVPAKSSNYKFAHSDSNKDKLDLFDLSGELSFKYQSAVTVEVNGAAQFLTNTARSSRHARSSVMYKLQTVKKSINLHDPEVRSKMFKENIPPQATHVVSSVVYGGNLVATYEQKADDTEDLSNMKGMLEAKIKLTMIDISAKIDLTMNTENRVTSKDTSVYIFGDILPGVKDDGSVVSVPLDPEGVVDFMASAHIETVESGGVPVWITLTPIKWLITDLDRMVHELSNDIISQASDTRAEFDEGMQIINDLADEDNRGFLAWTWEVEAFRAEFEVFEVEYKTNLSAQLINFRRGDSEISAISDILNNFKNSKFTLPLVRKFSETQFDRLISLREMVSGIEAEGGVQMAKRFSEYMAKTFSSDYDAVIALVLAGMNPSQDRTSMTALRRFYAFAKRNLITEAGYAHHCIQSVKDENVGLTCMENYKLVIIHFDSFCTQFCDSQYCGSQIRSCEDADASAQLDPTDDKEAWCRNPCTRVIAHFKQGPARKADSLLPDILEAPSIISLTDEAVELEPHNQKVVLKVQRPEGDLEILHWRVRITQYKFNDVNEKWIRHESLVETRTDAANVTLAGLTAGEKYIFEVAGVNAVDAGPYSEIYGSRAGTLIAQPMLTIESKINTTNSVKSSSACGLSPFQVQTFDAANEFSAPNWKPWDVSMAVSTLGPNQEKPGVVTFDDGDQMMYCGNLKLDPADKHKLSCSIPCNAISETKTYAIKLWNPSQTTLIAESTLHHLAPSGHSCQEFQQGSLFCDVHQDSPQWGCVKRAPGDNECSNCYDAQTELTYYGSHTCSGNKCQMGKKWCNKKSTVNNGCITDPCASDSCDPESVQVSLETGEEMCALPCHFTTMSGSIHVLQDGKAVSKLLPNRAANITCAAGFHHVGSNSHLEYQCVNNVQEDHYDLEDPTALGGNIPVCEINHCVCSNGVATSGIDCASDGETKCTSDCDDGYRLSGGVCQQTCAAYTCPAHYVTISAQSSSTSVSDSKCCQQTCAKHPCPTGYVANSEQSGSTLISDSSCCSAKCGSLNCGRARGGWTGRSGVENDVCSGYECKKSECCDEVLDYNNYIFDCTTTGTGFFTYDASALTKAQLDFAAETWPGLGPEYWACAQGCSGTCIQRSTYGVMANVG
eukprot:TRINITY_DN25228_c0_g1_i1.p1 TRINITY_DN25228_c0_g1~~TRINITY_DN25228_c0_g1_i1.p1  ORF type:complete len:1212 (-),score=132.07 TRINITY_DN25228_c0_g1_i1:153-3728(-)